MLTLILLSRVALLFWIVVFLSFKYLKLLQDHLFFSQVISETSKTVMKSYRENEPVTLCQYCYSSNYNNKHEHHASQDVKHHANCPVTKSRRFVKMYRYIFGKVPWLVKTAPWKLSNQPMDDGNFEIYFPKES